MFTILDVRLIFILSSRMDEELDVQIRARNRQYSSCTLLQETKTIRILTKPGFTAWTTSSTILGQCLVGNIKTLIFGLILIFRFRRGRTCLSNTIKCNYSPTNTGSLLYSKRDENKRLEQSDTSQHWWPTMSSTTAKDRHYDTSTIGPEGKFNWVLQLINNQKYSCSTVSRRSSTRNVSPNSPNQSHNQSVIEQGSLRTCKMCVCC